MSVAQHILSPRIIAQYYSGRLFILHRSRLIERDSQVLIRFSPFFIGDGWIAGSTVSTTPPYFVTRFYKSAVTL